MLPGSCITLDFKCVAPLPAVGYAVFLRLTQTLEQDWLKWSEVSVCFERKRLVPLAAVVEAPL